ncbi:MAG: winged helix family transcriptional regulator [Chitinophagaceae bacterium]|nr:MAG: winged helix family transcriptional regulator [Chitinophagaceae bacterium]
MAGHQLLRAAGDSSSLVPAVQQEPDSYRLSLPASWSLPTDSVVAIVNRSLQTAGRGDDFVVNLVARGGEQVYFGYALSDEGGKTLVPCLGRTLPARGYNLEVRFHEGSRGGWRTAGAATLALLALGLFARGALGTRRSPVAAAPAQQAVEIRPVHDTHLHIGRYRFVPEEQCLYLEGTRIALTSKEARLLELFATRPNELIDRKELQRVWEDEGVIVGRSLDVFVSRLRKKLEADSSIAIVGVTGKGYRLEVG